MKSIYLLFIYFSFASFVSGQTQSISSFRVIDTPTIGKWPMISLSGGQPIISSDGKYATYFIRNQPLNRCTFFITNTVNLSKT
jgi:hypothetical protein